MSDIYKTNDIRGVYPGEINESYAYALGTAFSQVLGCESVAVGYDARRSSPALYAALMAGIQSTGAKAIPLGLCPSEVVYYVAGREYADAAVSITASHNPPQYNGFKIVRKGGEMLVRGDGLADIRDFCESARPVEPRIPATLPETVDYQSEYVEFIFGQESWLPPRGHTVVIDAGNGVAGEFWKLVEPKFPGKVIFLNERPDGAFPARGPDPYVPGSLGGLVDKVKETGADIGLAYDGDADRVAVVSSSGRILSGGDILAVIAGRILSRHAGEGTVACNMVMSRRTTDYLSSLGWKTYLVPVGHGLIKTIMRQDPSLLFVGETSGHFYYRRFFCADSAFLTSMVMIDMAAELDAQLARLPTCWLHPEGEPRVGVTSFESGVNLCRDAARVFIESREIAGQPFQLACEVEGRVIIDSDQGLISTATGIRCDVADAWFCLRPSGTEPIIRITAEAKSRAKLDRWLYQLEQLLAPG